MMENILSSEVVRLIDTKQAVNLIGCSISSFKGYLSRGTLYPCKKVSGKNFYNEELIKNFTPPTPSQCTKTKQKFLQSKSSAPADMKDIVKKWRTSSYDTSSADVQIGIHTEKIRQLESDMKGISYDDSVFANMRALLIKNVFERRRLLNYLQASDFTRYKRAVKFIEEEGVAS